MKALIYDTETTGLIENSTLPLEKQPRIIEFFGRIVEDDGKIIEELEFLCNPGHRLEPITTKITGIKTRDVVNEPPFAEREGEVRALFGKADAMVAHNLSYDFDMVSLELRRCGTLDKIKWPDIRICTVEETEWYKGHRLNLQGLHEHLFNEGFPNAHRARTDVDALTRIYVELRNRGDI